MKNLCSTTLLLALLSLGACNQSKDGKSSDDVSAKELINNPNTDANPEGKVEVEAAAIEFSTLEYDFGKVTNGELVKYRFAFKNTGKNPLIIQNAQASCGCTVPQWPTEPIAPNDTGSIYVEFNSANRVGQQDKHVTITANTNPSNTVLSIKGEVLGILEKGPLKAE
jgi:hypothetical protein